MWAAFSELLLYLQIPLKPSRLHWCVLEWLNKMGTAWCSSKWQWWVTGHGEEDCQQPGFPGNVCASFAVSVGLVKANHPCLMNGKSIPGLSQCGLPTGRHSCESPRGKRSITHSLEHRPQVKYIMTTFKYTVIIYISSKNKISHTRTAGCIPKVCVRRVLKAVFLKGCITER